MIFDLGTYFAMIQASFRISRLTRLHLLPSPSVISLILKHVRSNGFVVSIVFLVPFEAQLGVDLAIPRISLHTSLSAILRWLLPLSATSPAL